MTTRLIGNRKTTNCNRLEINNRNITHHLNGVEENTNENKARRMALGLLNGEILCPKFF